MKKLVQYLKKNSLGFLAGAYVLGLLSLPIIDYVEQGKKTGEGNYSKQDHSSFENTMVLITSPEFLFMKQVMDKCRDTADYYVNDRGLPVLKNDSSTYHLNFWGNYYLLDKDKK